MTAAPEAQARFTLLNRIRKGPTGVGRKPAISLVDRASPPHLPPAASRPRAAPRGRDECRPDCAKLRRRWRIGVPGTVTGRRRVGDDLDDGDNLVDEDGAMGESAQAGSVREIQAPPEGDRTACPPAPLPARPHRARGAHGAQPVVVTIDPGKVLSHRQTPTGPCPWFLDTLNPACAWEAR
jgi:hypothetical protein